MQKTSLSESQLVIVELGAEWPSAALSAPPSARRVLVQEDAELPAVFAARVSEQLNDLQARGTALSCAVIACSERLDAGAQGARAELARAVASSLARQRGGELELVATDRNAGRSRPALSALVGDLRSEWQSAAVQASLRFGNEPPDAQQATAEAKSRTGSRVEKSKNGARRVA